MDCLRRRLSLAVLAPSILIGMTSPLPAGEPLDLVKSAAERAIQALKDPKLRAPEKKQERIERLKEIINPIFDYEETARRTMGRHWRRRTLAEQKVFYKPFRAFLEKI